MEHTRRQKMTPVPLPTPAELVNEWETQAERYRDQRDWDAANLMSLCAMQLAAALRQEKDKPAKKTETETVTYRWITWRR